MSPACANSALLLVELTRTSSTVSEVGNISVSTPLDRTLMFEMPSTEAVAMKGIEPPTERHAARKPSEGTLRIAASQEGNSIVIRIQDDGRGIALSKVKAKALAKGLISEAELSGMEPREIVNLIFLPGFSTAEKVTDVSGRGVGMDVVRTNIRKMNGTVEIESEESKGSLITIKLPLTIAIIQALMVEVERATFAIPLSSVIEAVRISKADIKTINGREVLHLRDAHIVRGVRGEGDGLGEGG